MVVVEAVGASPSEQASSATEQSRATSAAEASVEIAFAESACVESACVERALLPAAFDFDFDFDLALNSSLSADDPVPSDLLPLPAVAGRSARATLALQISSPVMVISGTRNRLIVASNARISSVSPEAESASTTSPRTTM